MTTLLRDVIDIPEHAGAEDYVLRLTDSVGHSVAQRTIDEYVVTPALRESFDTALGLVGESLRSGISRGAFLSGSFGSGKSHFMAVLYALLEQEPAARAKVALQPVIAKHDHDLADRRILPLAFHLLGADSMEQALFTGYLRQIRARHPQAPLPAVHKSGKLLDDADGIRASMGDEKFFQRLNQGQSASSSSAEPDPWSALLGPDSGEWNAGSYDKARAAEPANGERLKLTSALTNTMFTGYVDAAEYVDLDVGLAAISTHAKGLGYDAVVLFLDELVLWLAFAVQDREFFRRESQKLTKLVESSTGTRAIPLVSFVARQMDLRRWFADAGASGAEQEALDRAFKHQEGRFATITLGDANLPFVAQQRLLRPKDEGARDILNAAFKTIDRRPAVWDVLLDGVNTDTNNRGSDEQAFKLTYPFSPALISTLRSLASVMQRERTALKVMQQMLVDRRQSLTVDDLLPVGDSFDYIVLGGDALDTEAAALFKSASRLYEEKFLPLLRRNNEVDAVAIHGDPAALPDGFRADDRLVKTLLLSAVAPNVPALKALTGARLASLNHGSIVSPLPGGEASTVLAKVRAWAREVPELHIDGSELNPTIRVQLADVDYESIVERAKGEDNEGRRRELIKTLISDSLGIDLGHADLQNAYGRDVIWRGSRRRVEVIFGNVRDSSWLSDDHFRANPGTWRIIIDHPFDEQGHSGGEDFERLDKLTARNFQSPTIVWLPRFLSEERMHSLSRLVILNWLLDGPGDRWQSHADHLNEEGRAVAKNILESNRNTMRRNVEDAIQQAYGAASMRSGTVIDDPGHLQTLISLDRSFDPKDPTGATLGAAFEHLVGQAFDATYPGHPRFEPEDQEVKVPQLKIVAAHIARAAADKERRVELQGDQFAVRRIAGPLGVGTASEMHYILGDDRFAWGSQIERAIGRRENDGTTADAPISINELRGWIDAVEPKQGLRPEVSDLVIITWAALRQRAWYQHGVPLPAVPDPGSLQPSMELRTQPLPSPNAWSDAVTLAASMLGITVSPHMTAPTVAEFVAKVKDDVTALSMPATELVSVLESAYARIGLAIEPAPVRLVTARATAALMRRLKHLNGVDVVSALAESGLDESATAAGRSLKSAEAVTRAISSFDWTRLSPLLEALNGEGRARDDAAAAITRVRDALASDEVVKSAMRALQEAEEDSWTWLRRQPSPAPSPQPPAPAPAPAPANEPEAQQQDPVAIHTVTRRAGESGDVTVDQLRAFLSSHAKVDVDVTWKVRE